MGPIFTLLSTITIGCAVLLAAHCMHEWAREDQPHVAAVVVAPKRAWAQQNIITIVIAPHTTTDGDDEDDE